MDVIAYSVTYSAPDWVMVIALAIVIIGAFHEIFIRHRRK